MNKLQFWTLATEISDKYNMRGKILTSAMVELHAVCRWAYDTNASVERVTEEIEDTLAEVRGAKHNNRQRGVNIVEIQYHGSPRAD